MNVEAVFAEPVLALHCQLDALCAVFVHDQSLANSYASLNAQITCASALALLQACADTPHNNSVGNVLGGIPDAITLTGEDTDVTPGSEGLEEETRDCASMELQFCTSQITLSEGQDPECSGTDPCSNIACTYAKLFSVTGVNTVKCLDAACPGKYPREHVKCEIDMALEQAACLEDLMLSSCSIQAVKGCIRTPPQRLQFMQSCQSR